MRQEETVLKSDRCGPSHGDTGSRPLLYDFGAIWEDLGFRSQVTLEIGRHGAIVVWQDPLSGEGLCVSLSKSKLINFLNK